MKNRISKLRRSFFIGVSALMIASAVFGSQPDESSVQGWFITGSFLHQYENDIGGIAVINDDSEDVEFGFGIVDLFRKIFS